MENSIGRIARYALPFALGVVGYRAFSSWLLEPRWPLAATFILLLFPVMNYLLLSRIVRAHHNGHPRFIPLLLNGMLMNWLAAFAVASISLLDSQFELHLFANSEPLEAQSPLSIYKGYFRWYTIFGLISTLLAIVVLYVKSKMKG